MSLALRHANLKFYMAVWIASVVSPHSHQISDPARHERALWPALRAGYQRKCPSCGEGEIFEGYLKLRQTCPVCQEDLSPARADDGPAYLTILIVGHLMIPFLHVSFTIWRPDPLVLFGVFGAACLSLSLYLLPRLKGAIVAFQWARQMHGFGDESRPPDP